MVKTTVTIERTMIAKDYCYTLLRGNENLQTTTKREKAMRY